MRPLRALPWGGSRTVAGSPCGLGQPVVRRLRLAAASGAEAFRTVKHAMGETVIPAQPKRVVALDQSFVDAVLTLETPVVGYTTYRSIDDEAPDYLGPVAAVTARRPPRSAPWSSRAWRRSSRSSPT